MWRRHGHTESWARNVVDGVRQTEVLVAGLRRKLIRERVEVVFLTLKVVLFLVVTQWLAVSAGLVCATMSNELISMWFLVGR